MTSVIKTSANGNGLKWFLGITIVLALAVGSYAIYEYFAMQKIWQTQATPQQAIDMFNQYMSQQSS